jgi:uncharacterized OB-fold protein
MTEIETAIDLPEPSEQTAAHRIALEAGRLTFQRCENGHAWLPPREYCPECLTGKWSWEDASGRAEVVSWVVYHRSYHPAFADRVPYNVVVAQLEEGPRLITNVVDITEDEGLEIGAPLEVVIEREGDVPVSRFRLSQSA